MSNNSLKEAARKLIPSSHLKKLISQSKQLSQEEINKWVEEYQKTKSKKSAEMILNHVSKMFATQIYQRDRLFSKETPELTFEDIFNQMVLFLFKKLPDFDNKKSQFQTFAMWSIYPIIKNPGKTFKKRFERENPHVSLDKAVKNSKNDEDATISKFIADENSDIEAEMEKDYQRSQIKNAINKLSPSDKEIVMNLFGFVTPKPEWTSKTGKVTVSSIARGMGQSNAYVKKKLTKILADLSSYLKQSRFDRYFELSRLITEYNHRQRR